MRNILTFTLLVLALAGTAIAIKNRMAATPAQAQTTPGKSAPQSAPAPNEIIVTYFTTNVRCPSCHKIEALARKSVESHFAKELRSGAVVFRVVNTDEPENQHFVQDYGLVSKTVIVSRKVQGKEAGWENLQDVWLKLGDEKDFDNYVSEAIRRMIAPGA